MVAFKLTKIDDWDMFEDLCCELWKKLWGDDNVDRYGRQGQSQKGVDIYHMSQDGSINAIQCKNVDKLTFKNIDDEIDKAKKFTPKLNSLTIATTLDRDGKLQSYVLEKSQENIQNGLFEVNIKFWDYISQELLKNTDVLRQFFPECFIDNYFISSILDITYNEFEKFNYLFVENNICSLKPSFENFSDENKYKFLILEGRFFLLCNNIVEGSKNFLKAFNYSCKDIEAKYYKSLGLFYNNEYEECRDILNQIIEENASYENIYDLLLLLNHNLTFSELKKLIPNELNESKLINFRLGLIAFEKSEYENTIEYLLKADFTNPIVSVYFNLVKLQIFYNENKHFYLENYDSFVEELRDIEHSLQDNLDVISDKILKHNIDWLINLTEINLYSNNNASLIINLKRGLKLSPNNSRLLFNKSKFLIKNNKIDEAISELKYLINWYISIYLLKDEKEKALNLINSLENLHDNYYYNLCMSDYYRGSEKSYNYLKLCKDSISICDREDKLVLANKFILCNDFNSAIEIYEDVLDLNYYTTEIEFLLECYLDYGEYKKIIDLCEKFISRGEYYPNPLKYLMHIYSMVHDYDNLKRISKLYLDNFGHDLDIKYNLMKINLMEKNYSEIDSFILEEQDFFSLDLEQCMFFYYLCVIRGFSIGEILKNKNEFGECDKVDWDNAVLLKYPNKEDWKFLSKSSNVYPFDTISEDDELSKILGKTIGEKITLGFNEIEILDIQGKFQHCFRVGLSKIEDFGSKYVMPIYLDNSEDLKPIFNVIDNYSKRVENITEYYKNKSMPIFLFSKLLGRDFIDSYNYLLKIGLNSFNENDLNNVNKKDKLVIDISSLLTIHYLNIENKLTEYYEFVASYSTLFLLREIYQKTKTQFSNEGELVYKHEGNYYRSENNFENKLELVEKLINWVEKNCEYLPIYGLLELNSDLKNSINNIDERFITDNILIASNKNLLFLCDDLYVKRIAKEFNVKSTGVLNLINDSYSKGFISENEYLSLTNTLYMNNFKKFYLKSDNIVYEIKNYNFLFLSKILLNINEFNVNIINVLVETILKISNGGIEENLLELVINLILNSLKNNQEMYFLFLKKFFYIFNKVVY